MCNNCDNVNQCLCCLCGGINKLYDKSSNDYQALLSAITTISNNQSVLSAQMEDRFNAIDAALPNVCKYKKEDDVESYKETKIVKTKNK